MFFLIFIREIASIITTKLYIECIWLIAFHSLSKQGIENFYINLYFGDWVCFLGGKGSFGSLIVLIRKRLSVYKKACSVAYSYSRKGNIRVCVGAKKLSLNLK